MICPFCTVNPSRIIIENDLAMAICDGFPVSPGHLLIIPKKHIASFFETTEQEQTALLKLLAEARGLVLGGTRGSGLTNGDLLHTIRPARYKGL
jgi:diadenosine tetraphosphate (Ap4A) HIT family hydrolase